MGLTGLDGDEKMLDACTKHWQHVVQGFTGSNTWQSTHGCC